MPFKTASILLALLAAWPIGAVATTFMEVPFPDTVKDAPLIVRGRAGNSYSDWSKGIDGTKRIYTFTDLSVDEVFKGSVNGRSLVFRELGGEKDGVGMQVAGAAHFDRGEDVVVFLNSRNEDGSYDLRGLSTGKYNLQRDSDGKEYLVGLGVSSGGEGMLHEDDRGHGDTSGAKKWTLESLRKLVRDQESGAVATRTNGPGSGVSATPRASVGVNSPTKQAAPQLQPTQPEETANSGNGTWIVFAAVIVLGALGLLAWLLRK